ncbi:MAG: ABC transporter permease [Candidatus Bipolaricaulota bacterium]|nr:ABC transporter permease [Candidatus Bipolaricaulota bacterium]MDW8152002.1 ABC transporter permease [Candidatus Bipolaricaulota bacterium]
MNWFLSWISGAILYAAPILFPTLGEVVEQRTGMVNLGLEGLMLLGASVGFSVSFVTRNAWLGVLAAAGVGLVANLIYAGLVVHRRAHQLAAGLALMFFGIGMSALIGKPYVGQMAPGLPKYALAGSQSLLFRYDPLVYLAFLLAPLLWFLLFRTRFGLWLRAVGESPAIAYAAGVSPNAVRYFAAALAGTLAAVGGAHLSLGITGTWSEGMTAGRGFIAIALVIFSRWNPLRAIAGALLFGGAVVLQLQLQAQGVGISPFFLDMLPYVLTLLVLLVWGRGVRHVAPASLGRVYFGTE